MTKLYKPKWQEAFETLSYEIDTGVFQPGDPFYSIKDVSDCFAFSNITARRVFDELKVCRRIRSRRRRNALVLGPASGDSPAEPVKPETVFLCFQSFGGRFDAAKHPRHTPHIYHGILRGFDRPPFDRLYRIEPISIDFCLSHLDVVFPAPSQYRQRPLVVTADNRRRWRRRAQHTANRFTHLVGIVAGRDPNPSGIKNLIMRRQAMQVALET